LALVKGWTRPSKFLLPLKTEATDKSFSFIASSSSLLI
jgi:hypothetical protein